MHAARAAETLALTLSGEKVRGNFHLILDADPDRVAIDAVAGTPEAHIAHWADGFAIDLDGADLDDGRHTITRALHVDTLDLRTHLALSSGALWGATHTVLEAEHEALTFGLSETRVVRHLAQWADPVDIGLDLGAIDDGRGIIGHALYVAAIGIGIAAGLSDWSDVRGRFHLVLDADPGRLSIEGAAGKSRAHLAVWADGADLYFDLGGVDDSRSIATHALHIDTLNLGIIGRPIREHVPQVFPAALHNLFRTRLPSE